MHHGAPIRVLRRGTTVVGECRQHPLGHVCVQILAPFGECAVEEARERLDPREPEAELLGRLFDVCCWAAQHAEELVTLDRDIRGELLRDGSHLDFDGVVSALRDVDFDDPQMHRHVDAITTRGESFDEALRQRAREVAEKLGCSWPDVAADAWEFMSASEFYARGRRPLPVP